MRKKIKVGSHYYTFTSDSPKVRQRTWKELSAALSKATERANKAETLLRLAIVYVEVCDERFMENKAVGVRPEHMRRLRAWRKQDEK